MLPLEPLFCPCCTPALLYALVQSDLSQQMLWLGTGSLSTVIRRPQKPPQAMANEV